MLYLQHCAPAPLALANQLPLPVIVQRGWSWHRCISSAIEESDFYLLLLSSCIVSKTAKSKYHLNYNVYCSSTGKIVSVQ